MTLKEVPDIQTQEMFVSADTVQILETYLAQAKAGRITEVVVVGIHAETKMVNMSCSHTMKVTSQLGALELAKWNILGGITLGDYFSDDDDEDT